MTECLSPVTDEWIAHGPDLYFLDDGKVNRNLFYHDKPSKYEVVTLPMQGAPLVMLK